MINATPLVARAACRNNLAGTFVYLDQTTTIPEALAPTAHLVDLHRYSDARALDAPEQPDTRQRRATLTRHRQDQTGDISLIKSGDHYGRAPHPRNKFGPDLGTHRAHGIFLAKRSKRGRDNRGGVQSGLGILDHRGVVVDKTVR